MAKMHREMIAPPVKWGIGDDPVYRYLICCKRCKQWNPGMPVRRGFGLCIKGHGTRAGNALSCDSFDIIDSSEIYLETARINGELTKVDVGGDVFYCDDDEMREIYSLLLGDDQIKK